jgi:hypothetical protein
VKCESMNSVTRCQPESIVTSRSTAHLITGIFAPSTPFAQNVKDQGKFQGFSRDQVGTRYNLRRRK